MMTKALSRIIHSRLALFTLLYLVVFLGISLVQRNSEFFFYTIVLIVMLFVVIIVSPRVRLEKWIMVFASLFILLHLSSGHIYICTTKLYDVYLISDFRMDNLVHLLGGFLSTFLAYNLLEPFIQYRVRNNPLTFSLIVVLLALGMGSINEILEFIGVIFFDAADAVGGYVNNAKDQVFNLFGTALAAVVIYIDRRFDADGKNLIPYPTRRRKSSVENNVRVLERR